MNTQSRTYIMGSKKVDLSDFQSLQIKDVGPNCTGFELTYLSHWPYLATPDKLNVPEKALKFFDDNQKLFHQDPIELNEGWSYLSLFGNFYYLFAPPEEVAFKSKHAGVSFNPIVEEIWPELIPFIKSLPFKVATAAVIALQPRARVSVHIDKSKFGLDKLLVPLNAPKNSLFSFYQYGAVPFDPGQVYAIDASHLHYAVNQSDSIRYNMIIRGTIEESLPNYLEWIKAGYLKNGKPRFVKFPDEIQWAPSNLIKETP